MKSRPEAGEPVNIGEAARLTGVSPKMIRHYEGLGLLPAPPRTDSGYRRYDGDAIHTLHFIRRSRDLGFSIADIGELLGLWRNRRRASSTVRKLALAHVDALQQRIDALTSMKRTLSTLVEQCHGDERAGCPILDDLAGSPGALDTRPETSPDSSHHPARHPAVDTKPRPSTRRRKQGQTSCH